MKPKRKLSTKAARPRRKAPASALTRITKKKTAPPRRLATPTVRAKIRAVKLRRSVRPRHLTIPPILLEADTPVAKPAPEPGPIDAPRPPAPAPAPATVIPDNLPEAYGTQQLLLAARDPHCLYAHWDLHPEQLRRCTSLSASGRLVLRVFKDRPDSEPVQEIDLFPGARDWFVRDAESATLFFAELGYHDTKGTWNRVTASEAAWTPPETRSEDTEVRFETIPIDVPFTALRPAARTGTEDNVPPVPARPQPGEERLIGSSASQPRSTVSWSPAEERILNEALSLDSESRVWIGSQEITDLLRRKIKEGNAPAAAAAPAPSEAAAARPAEVVSSVSAPFGEAAPPRGFWFNVNAELIIYGGTDPAARVSIAGQPIELRPDGTFSLRFALPDGIFELPLEAVSADGQDQRRAELGFSRATRYAGEVEAAPPDPKLTLPRPENAL